MASPSAIVSGPNGSVANLLTPSTIKAVIAADSGMAEGRVGPFQEPHVLAEEHGDDAKRVAAEAHEDDGQPHAHHRACHGHRLPAAAPAAIAMSSPVPDGHDDVHAATTPAAKTQRAPPAVRR